MALRALPTMMLRAAAAPARTSSRTIAPARQMQGLAGAALRSAVRVERAAAGPMTRLQTRASSTYSSSPKGTFPSLVRRPKRSRHRTWGLEHRLRAGNERSGCV